MSIARTLTFSLILLSAGLPGNIRAAGDDGVPLADRDKVLGPGDVVTLEIQEDKTPPVAKRVTDTGDLDVPVIGRVHVAGKSCSEVAAQVTKLLEADYYYKATVKLGIDQINRVKAGNASKIFISGQVKLPAPQDIAPGEKLTVSGAVVRAGGGTQFADMRKVKLSRKNKDGSSKTFIVDVKGVLEEGKMDKDIELVDGDYVFVPQRLFTW